VLQVFEENIMVSEEDESDPEIDNMIDQLGIAEHQVNKVRRTLANRLDKSNPVVFSKSSSTYAFKSDGKIYRITIEADTFNNVKKSFTYAFRNALKSPAFIITLSLCSAIVCVLSFVNLYWASPVLGTISDKELTSLDRQYSLILDRCAGLMNDNGFNPRSLGAQYAVCNKSIIQLHEFCKDHQMATCQDRRIDLYLNANKPGW
jgi:hypothetical protein